MQLALRLALDDDLQFCFDAKRDALGPHITRKWGWDQEFQRKHHLGRWSSKPWQIITLGATPIGTVSIDWRLSYMQFGEFYILNAYRGQGLGTKILTEALMEADQKNSEARLEYLKWNPVSALYARHGFKVLSENETHYFLARTPNQI